jgi:hypothetical protein
MVMGKASEHRQGKDFEMEMITMPRLHSNVARRRDLHSSGNSSVWCFIHSEGSLPSFMTQSECNTQSLRAARRGSQKLDMVCSWRGVLHADSWSGSCAYVLLLSSATAALAHCRPPRSCLVYRAYSEHIATCRPSPFTSSFHVRGIELITFHKPDPGLELLVYKLSSRRDKVSFHRG